MEAAADGTREDSSSLASHMVRVSMEDKAMKVLRESTLKEPMGKVDMEHRVISKEVMEEASLGGKEDMAAKGATGVKVDTEAKGNTGAKEGTEVWKDRVHTEEWGVRATVQAFN